MLLDVGEAAPSFRAPTLNGNANYGFDSVAGRPIVLLFLGSGGWGPSAEALALLARNDHLFDDEQAAFFGVTVDPADAATGRIFKRLPGIRWFLDYEAKVSRTYGAAAADGEKTHYLPHWLLLDERLRVVQRAAIGDGALIFDGLRALIARGQDQSHAPVLVVPRVFEPEICRTLIGLYEKNGGRESGFMREENGLTVRRTDDSFKRRSDYDIEDEALRSTLLHRLRRRLTPEIYKAFQFHATRIERWIVACYDSESGGFFRPHRDNTTAGTAHRKFACTINLNAEDFDGGELRFPEFGQRTYRAPTGGAVIFSCSLLHEATAVTRGKRYAFLPFFYDDAAARLRERNQAQLEPGLNTYRMSPPPEEAKTTAG
ncbi:2OG-Fe(II) oxygenase [Sphingomonas crusticola]|uniref:2OG-Fe(II) oxygenase n=1 Tax=Sphingomonas crusticola TaxID=1697973 RepID=UPI000E2635A6|nr:2OG-Fe(II) oxygenase [Sphingomonas crusticola]